jgi:transcriptional regulator of acetoin/glycerol metabolism
MFNRLMNLPTKTKDRLGVSLMAEILGISRQWFYTRLKKWDEMKEFE